MFRKLRICLVLILLVLGILWVPRLPSAWTLWAVGLCLDATQPTAPQKEQGKFLLFLDEGGAMKAQGSRFSELQDDSLRSLFREAGRTSLVSIELQVYPEVQLGDVVRGVLRLRQAAADTGKPLRINVEWVYE